MVISQILKWFKGDERIGKKSQWMHPGWGSCYKCQTTWNLVDNHTTNYTSSSGCFPLCELCWSELTISKRIPFYHQLLDEWFKDKTLLNGETKQDLEILIIKAVREGK